MKGKVRLSITFQPVNDSFLASFNFDDLDELPDKADLVLQKASKAYARRVHRMRELMKENIRLRRERKPVPAALMWKLGDQIFGLIDDLGKLNAEIEGLYYHLNRDIGVSNTTLKRVVALRRYIPDVKMLPKNLKWGELKGAPKKYVRRAKEKGNL